MAAAVSATCSSKYNARAPIRNPISVGLAAAKASRGTPLAA